MLTPSDHLVSCDLNVPIAIIDRMDNYRPIALASVISKVVEIILLNIISKLLSTCPNQFGCQQKLGTDTCIYILKEIVEKYSVYLCVS